MSCGNLNNLSMPTLINATNEGLNFINFMENKIKLANVCDSTKTLHFDTHRQLKDYKCYQDIRDINCDFLLHLEAFMRNEKKLSINTIARHMKVIKRYINVARKKEIILKDPFLNYTIKSQETHRESLTEKELELIEQYQQQNEPDEILNAFLYSCYTGLRYSDIYNITNRLADIYTDITTSLNPSYTSFPFFFWVVWASGNDALETEIIALSSIRLLTDFLCSHKHSKVSFELLKGFSAVTEKWQQQGMF
ncbi:site-specific integrase [Bacteroides fragilis]